MGEALVKTHRWRVFADAVSATLGVHLWLILALLPVAFADQPTLTLGVAVGLPLLFLAVGIWQRSDAMLLFGFPISLLLPVAVSPPVTANHFQSAWRFALAAAGLITYLFSASVLTAAVEPPPPDQQRVLSSAQKAASSVWLRRFRVYLWLTILSAVFPAVLLYAVNFDAESLAFLKRTYAGRSSGVAVLINLGVMVAWGFLYLSIWLGVFRPHRTGDRDLELELQKLRLSLKSRGRRPSLVVAVAAVVSLCVAYLLFRVVR